MDLLVMRITLNTNCLRMKYLRIGGKDFAEGPILRDSRVIQVVSPTGKQLD